jgi:CBS domain-containing protein
MKVSDVMTSPAITVTSDAPWPEVAERMVVAHPDEDVAEAVRRMLAHHVKWLPVVEHDRVVGVVARRDLLAAAWPHPVGVSAPGSP